MRACLRGVKKNWHWIFFGFVALLTAGMDVFVATHILDGDASDFLNRARIIAQCRNPFTQDIHLTTELRPLDIATVFSLFFYFTNDWSLVRICGTALMQALYVASFFYLCKRAHVASPRVRAVSAALLLLPFSVPYGRIVLYHAHYILYLTNAFWMLGLTLGLVECKERRKAILPACLLGALWAFVGLNGVRHMLILGLPLLAFAAVRALAALRGYRWENGRLTGEDAFSHTETARLLWVLAGSMACFLVGYLIHSKVLIRVYDMANMGSASFCPNQGPAHYTDIFNGWLVASGVRCSSLPLIGTAGAALCAALFSFGYLLAVSAASLWEKGPIGPRLMEGMLAASFATTTLVFVFDSGNRFYELYYVPVVALAFPTLAQELMKLKERAVSACRKLLIALSCACFLYQGAYTMYYVTVDRWDMDDWTGLSQQDIFLADTAQKHADFMKEASYTHALAPYWYANVIMELTDGELTVAPLALLDGEKDAVRIGVYRWGTSKTAFEKASLPDKLVVFVYGSDAPKLERGLAQVKKVYEDRSVCAYEISPDDIS